MTEQKFFRFQDKMKDPEYIIKGKKYIQKGFYTHGTVAYIISLKGANKLLTKINPLYHSIDIIIADTVKTEELECYSIMNNIIKSVGGDYDGIQKFETTVLNDRIYF